MHIEEHWWHSRYLDQYRRSEIIVCVGRGAWEDESIEDTRALDNVFREKYRPASTTGVMM